LNAAQTPAQVASVITLMKRETANRMTGFEEEKTALRESMRTGKPAANTATASSANQVQTPDGQIRTFPTKQQADAFRRAAGL
jgi:hypothetical protein